MVDVGKQRRVGYNRSRDTLFTGSNPVLTTNKNNFVILKKYYYLCVMAKLKQFSYFSQSGADKNTQYYIMAKSQKQVIELFEKIGKPGMTASDVRDFVYQAWGNDGDEIMKGIEIIEPSIYGVSRTGMFGKSTSEPIKLG